MRASCIFSVFTFVSRILREHLQAELRALADETDIVLDKVPPGCGTLLYSENWKKSQLVSRVLVPPPVFHEVKVRAAGS